MPQTAFPIRKAVGNPPARKSKKQEIFPDLLTPSLLGCIIALSYRYDNINKGVLQW